MIQFGNTLKKCGKDILSFAFMFFIIFVSYAQLGYILFGTQLEDFRTFRDSMFTLLRTILGDFDYLAIEKANRLVGPIYFLTYIFIVFFVLLNMFLAIINDTYAAIKTTSEDQVLPLGKFIKEKIRQICGVKSKIDNFSLRKDDGEEFKENESTDEEEGSEYESFESKQKFEELIR